MFQGYRKLQGYDCRLIKGQCLYMPTNKNASTGKPFFWFCVQSSLMCKSHKKLQGFNYRFNEGLNAKFS